MQIIANFDTKEINFTKVPLAQSAKKVSKHYEPWFFVVIALATDNELEKEAYQMFARKYDYSSYYQKKTIKKLNASDTRI